MLYWRWKTFWKGFKMMLDPNQTSGRIGTVTFTVLSPTCEVWRDKEHKTYLVPLRAAFCFGWWSATQ